MAINYVVMEGNLTRDAEEREANGSTVFRFSVAHNVRRKGREPEASFFDCDAWAASDAQAAYFRDVLAKGAHVVVSGQLRQRSWEAQDGTKRSAVSIVVRDLTAMQRADGAQTAQRKAATRPKAAEQDVYDEEIPF